MNQKIILQFLVGLLILLAAFLGGYLFRQNDNFQTASISSIERFSENDSIKPSAKILPRLERISASKVVSAANGESGHVVYMEKEAGKIIQVDYDGINKKILSGTIIKDLNRAVWPSADLYLIYFAKTAKGLRPYFLDIKNQKTNSLNDSINYIVFSPRGDKIAYHSLDYSSEEGGISISQPDGSISKIVLKTRIPSLVLDWPKENLLSFYKRAIAGEAVDLFILDHAGQKLEKVLEGKVGLDIKWSNTGKYLLYSFFDSDNKLRLALKDMDNQKEREAAFSTFAGKCSFGIDEKKVYCGVPAQAPTTPIKAGFIISKDKLEEWDIEKEINRVLLEPSSFDEIQIINPFISPVGDRLFFINLLNDHLYRLNL